MTVASIIISGHLRDACEDHTHLLAFKRACEQSYDVCNVFICTWTTVDVRSNISSSGCLHNISSALMPVGMLVDSQGKPSARKWGRTGVSFSDVENMIRLLRECSALSLKWRAPASQTYRLRFDRNKSPSLEVLKHARQDVVSTYAHFACKANIDNVFWGTPEAMDRLLSTWYLNARNYSRRGEALFNQERSLCLASIDANIRMVESRWAP